jgi:hypothetical protein
MKLFTFSLAAILVGAVAIACNDQTDPAFATLPPDEVSHEDAGGEPTPDAGPSPDVSADAGLSGKCADTFGDKLTAGFGRIDGIVYAVQKPSDTECTMPNDDHLIVQVLMNGAVYRLVTNVLGTGADPDIRYAVVPHALPEPAFEEGWHEGVALDYVKTLDVHNADFKPYGMDDLVAKVASALEVGAKVSVYATSGDGRPESAHLIHRNKSDVDGAIVVSPTGSPKFLLFHFDNQTF